MRDNVSPRGKWEFDSAQWNEDMLHEAGFKKVDMFWRCLNFCGWVAVK